MLFRMPYRWRWSTLGENLSSAAGDIVRGIRNLIRWAPVIWFDADFDWAYLATVMEYKLRRSAHLEATVGHHVGSQRDAQRMRVCADLLKRLLEDEYFENAGYRQDGWKQLPYRRRRQIVDHATAMQKQDQQYLGRLLGKHLTHWWD